MYNTFTVVFLFIGKRLSFRPTIDPSMTDEVINEAIEIEERSMLQLVNLLYFIFVHVVLNYSLNITFMILSLLYLIDELSSWILSFISSIEFSCEKVSKKHSHFLGAHFK